MPSPPSTALLLLPALLLLLLLQSLLPAVSAASPLPPPLPLLNQDVLVQVSLLLTSPPPPPHPTTLDLRFTCASTSAALTLNSTYTLFPPPPSSFSVRGDALVPKQQKKAQAQPAWSFAVDRHQLQKLQPCWVTAHATDPPRQQLGLEVVSPPATAMQLSILLKVYLPSSSSSSSSSSSHTSWLSTLKQQTHHAHTQLLELLITQGWRRGEIVAEDVLALFFLVLLFVCFSVVMGQVVLTWVRGKEEKEEEEEEEENEASAGRVKRTSSSSSSSTSLALVPSRSTSTTTHRRRSSSSSSNSNNQLITTTTTTTSTSSKKRGKTTTTAANTTASPPGDSSSSPFLDVPFSSQWQCVVHDRRASPTLLADRDLDTVAAATTSRRGRQQQRIPVAKDVVARLLVDDQKLRGVVLSAKTCECVEWRGEEG